MWVCDLIEVRILFYISSSSNIMFYNIGGFGLVIRLVFSFNSFCVVGEKRIEEEDRRYSCFVGKFYFKMVNKIIGGLYFIIFDI